MRDLEAIKADANAATNARTAAMKAQEEAIKRVRLETQPAIDAATRAMNGFLTEFAKAKEAAATHEWVGKKVVRTEVKYKRWGPDEKTQVYGIVEIVGPSNPWSGRAYSAVSAGDPVVRLLKKDGKPGLKHERLCGISGSHSLWSLVDDAAIAKALGQ